MYFKFEYIYYRLQQTNKERQKVSTKLNISKIIFTFEMSIKYL